MSNWPRIIEVAEDYLRREKTTATLRWIEVNEAGKVKTIRLGNIEPGRRSDLMIGLRAAWRKAGLYD